jgi:hypothetical protein
MTQQAAKYLRTAAKLLNRAAKELEGTPIDSLSAASIIREALPPQDQRFTAANPAFDFKRTGLTRKQIINTLNYLERNSEIQRIYRGVYRR